MKDLLYPLSALCSGSPALDRHEQVFLADILAREDESLATSLACQGAPSDPVDAAAEEPPPLADRGSRPQTDLTPLLMGHLMTPIDRDVQVALNRFFSVPGLQAQNDFFVSRSGSDADR